MRRAFIQPVLMVVAMVAVLQVCAAELVRTIPRPLPSHPGNIFLAGQSVVVAEPPGQGDAWRAVDYDGKTIAHGNFVDGKAALGPLPVGWYKIIRGHAGHWTNRVSAAVLEPLRAPTPETSPIDIDVAMAWMYPKERMPDVISLCELAGINRVRDRVSWPEIEPKRGEFAEHTRNDDSVSAQTAAGLKVLDVNHISPAWANTNSTRFPRDLRDVYDAYRELARRWKGKIEAFEPWNEADIHEFGGHMGSEMATMQKAAWLGLKAGNPDLTVCENVFAIHREATLKDFQNNEAWPYFDTFNLHHYDPFKDYPRLFQQFRGVSGGRPMWVTECNVIVNWRDEKTKEPSEEDLRIQAERVPMIYSMDIYEGAKAVFYFMLPHYVEYYRQYGVLRPDLTPRPAFVAIAAAGRLLADAKPMGRIRTTNESIHGYVFKTKPDGKAAEMLVVWSETNATITLPKAPIAAFDHLGRERAIVGTTISAGRAPQYLELAHGGRPDLILPPKLAKVLTGRPSPVVLQALLPESDIIFKQSACRVVDGTSLTVPIAVYNFSPERVSGSLNIQVPTGWKAFFDVAVSVEPHGRAEVPLSLTRPPGPLATNAGIMVHGKFGRGGKPVLSFQLTSTAP